MACHKMHVVPLTLAEDELGETFEWNGDFERPTITPMIVVAGICMVSVRDGVAYYGFHAPHDMPGMKAELPHILQRANA